MRIFSWNKQFLSNTYTIAENAEERGHLKGNNIFSSTSEANFMGKDYKFVSEHWYNQNAKVYKAGQTEPMARINFNGFTSKAEIIYNGKIYQLKFLDLWQTRWQISKNDECILKSKKSSLSGGEAEIDDEYSELLLIALYASNYFYTIGFLLVIIVIVLVISN
jgi:hypothetical protein